MQNEITNFMNNNNCVVAVYKLHTEAEAAINELNKSVATITPMNM